MKKLFHLLATVISLCAFGLSFNFFSQLHAEDFFESKIDDGQDCIQDPVDIADFECIPDRYLFCSPQGDRTGIVKLIAGEDVDREYQIGSYILPCQDKNKIGLVCLLKERCFK